ncbi:MAG: sugar phosphate isomerase/epimerase [Elusimicrobiota bacterium]
MFILSAFGDEIAPELNEQLDLLESEGIKYLDLRGVWGKNVKLLNDEDCEKIKKILDTRGFKLSTIGSPVGKIKITDDFEPEIKVLERMIHLAKFFGTKYIRVFSFYVPKTEAPDNYREEVMRRMKVMAALAEKHGVMLELENEGELYGEKPLYVMDVVKTVNSPNLKVLFDAANYVIAGVKPHTGAFPIVKDQLDMFHIKDATKTEPWIINLAGEGQGQIPDTLAVYKNAKRDYFLVLEPHLGKAEKMSGFSGPEKFRLAIKALKNILDNMGAKY